LVEPTDPVTIHVENEESLIAAEAGATPDSDSPTMWFDPLPWDTGIELGVNGSSGTSESLSVRTGGYVKRESRFSKLDLRSYYNYTTTGGFPTQNNAELDARNDWLLDDRSPWTLYGTGNLFYDEFQAFDLQTSANTGVGYRFVHEPGLDFIARFGGGVSREIGGPDDRWVPESLLGFEYAQQLSPTQKFYGKLDYYPEWEEIGEYRLVADTGWEIVLVQPSNLSLKISATDRYDSTPNGAEPHLLNYSVLLLLKL
jgi:putative salt-induced outer membrane protein YdiY